MNNIPGQTIPANLLKINAYRKIQDTYEDAVKVLKDKHLVYGEPGVAEYMLDGKPELLFGIGMLDGDIYLQSKVIDDLKVLNSITIGDDRFDGIESEINDSDNPIKSKAVNEYKNDLEARIAFMNEQIDDLWKIVRGQPIKYKDGVLIIDTMYTILKDIVVADEILTAIDESGERGLPSAVFNMSETEPEVLVIKDKLI